MYEVSVIVALSTKIIVNPAHPERNSNIEKARGAGQLKLYFKIYSECKKQAEMGMQAHYKEAQNN